MRVVNSIEQEIIQVEWESWLLEENVKCKHLGAMLSHNTTEHLAGREKNRQLFLNGKSRRIEEIWAWQRQYCESCNKEQEIVV